MPKCSEKLNLESRISLACLLDADYLTLVCLVRLKSFSIEMSSTLLLINHRLDPLIKDLCREL